MASLRYWTLPPLSPHKPMMSRLSGNAMASVGTGRPLAGQNTTPARSRASMRSAMFSGMVPSSANSVRSMSTASSLMSARPRSAV